MISLLLVLSAAVPPSDLLEQAFLGRSGSRWSGIALVDRPGGEHKPDTARVCREGTSERLDFRETSIWIAGDSTVILRPAEKTGWKHPKHRPPPDMEARIVGTDRFLGRSVLLVEARGPFGHGHRLWIDTSLPAVLKGEPLGKEDHPGPERQFLSIRPGTGCPQGSFQLPADWTWREGPPPPPPGGPDEPRREHRRHEASSLAELSSAVGFDLPSPPWLPAGFQPRNFGWVETREGRAAQVLYTDGTRNVSIFWRPLGGPPPYCPAGGCKDRQGKPVVFGVAGRFGLAVTGDLPSEDLERVAGTRK